MVPTPLSLGKTLWRNKLTPTGTFLEVPMRRVYLFYMLATGSQTFGCALLWAQETGFLDRALTVDRADYKYVV